MASDLYHPCVVGAGAGADCSLSKVHELVEAKDEKRLLRFQKQLAKQELLIVDELGFVPLSKTGA
jgi:DNA replication protein DnaC